MKDRTGAIPLPAYGCAIAVSCLIANADAGLGGRLFHLVSGMGGGAGVMADSAAGILPGFVSAFLGALVVGGLGSLVGARRRPKGTGRAFGRRPRMELVLMGGLATLSGLAAVSCGGVGHPGVAGSGADGAAGAVITLGVLAGGAIGILAGFRLCQCLGPLWRSFDSQLLRLGMTLLPEHARERWYEEWQGELAQISSPWRRFRFCASLLLGMPWMAWALRSALARRRDG